MTKIPKPKVSNLPPHAQLKFHHSRWFAYFPYTYSINGKRGQEKDYIGHIDPQTLSFVPNDFFLNEKPVFSHRNPDRWKNPEKRRLAKLLASKTVEAVEPPEIEDLELIGDYTRMVGGSALAVKLLDETGMSFDLGKAVFNGNLQMTMDLLNLSIHGALTNKPIYLGRKDSKSWKFIGKGCLDPTEASRFLHSIGLNGDLSVKIGKARAARLAKGELLALDGTRIDCNSKQISIAAVGKDKKGGYSSQINYSVLVNAVKGAAICYRCFAGNTSDTTTIKEFATLWNVIGIKSKDPIIELDRGYDSSENLMTLDINGLRCIVGLRASIKQVREIMEDHNSDFYSGHCMLPHYKLYAVKCPKTFEFEGWKKDFDVFVFHNPETEAEETNAFIRSLHVFEKEWSSGKYDWDSHLLKYYITPSPGSKLVRNDFDIDTECYFMGYFGIATNIAGLDCEEVLQKYGLRGDVEVLFKEMFKYLLKSTLVHTTASLDGFLLVVFVALDIITALRSRMTRPLLPTKKYKGRQIRDKYTIASLLKQLNSITLSNISGHLILGNVTEEDRNLVKSLGLEGLYDDASQVERLLSAQHLSETLLGGA